MSGSIRQILRCGLASPRTFGDLGCSLKLWWLRPSRESREKQLAVVRFGSKADIETRQDDVRYYPKSGHCRTTLGCPLCANNGLMHRSKQQLHSITSSARAS